MADQLQKVDASNRKESPHQQGSELGVSSQGSEGAVFRVGNTQFSEAGQGATRPTEYASVAPIYSNAMLQDMQMLFVPASELKATNLGDAYAELFSLSQKYPDINPKAYMSELKVNVVPESSAATGAGDFPSGGTLFVQYAAEDLASPHLSGDLDAMQNSQTPVFAALNPSWAGLTNLVGSGKFNSVVISGQGKTDAVSAVDESGLNDEVTAEEILSLIQGSSIQNVVLSSAEGSTGMSTIASQLQEAGLNVMTFMQKVGSDASSNALNTLVGIANQMGQPGFSKEVFQQAAAAFDAGGGALIAKLLEFERGEADLEEMGQILESIIPEAKSKLEKANGKMDLKTLAAELTKGDAESEGQTNEAKAESDAEGSLPEMTVSVGGGQFVEEMPSL
jgi:hypothetical protein